MSLEKWRKKNEQENNDRGFNPVLTTAAGAGIGAGIGDAEAQLKYKDSIRLEPIHPKIVERRKAVNKMLKAMGRNKELVDETAYVMRQGIPMSKRVKFGGIGAVAGGGLAYALARLLTRDRDET